MCCGGCNCCCCAHYHDDSEDMADENANPNVSKKAHETGSSNEVIGDGGADGEVSTVNSTTYSESTGRWNIAVYEDDDPDYNNLLIQAEAAIEAGIFPERIVQGSSGSYFVKNSEGGHIGVFKPKNEEPYGRMNPKWGKWFQRHCCCCCFGRGCLIPNTGYLSEAGASLVDLRLGLNVVPKTKVIRMASSTFHYGRIKRGTARARKTLADRFPMVGKRFHRIGLPLKIGSFQIFVKGYKDAIIWIQQFETDPLPPDIAQEFQLEFERLVILDYVIRNTDRGHDNWLVRYDKEGNSAEDGGINLAPFSYSSHPKGGDGDKVKKHIKIAAIDNGLAFPFKHPDEWRTYPFTWAKLPFAKEPFSEETRNKYLPVLSNISLIEELCTDLYFIFSLDKSFKMSLFEKQLSVMRGQILNLANALRDGKSPAQLVQMPPIRVLKDLEIPLEPIKHLTTSVNKTPNSRSNPKTMKISPTNTLMFDEDEYKPEFHNEAPVFRSW